jgi:hypothetical protein
MRRRSRCARIDADGEAPEKVKPAPLTTDGLADRLMKNGRLLKDLHMVKIPAFMAWGCAVFFPSFCLADSVAFRVRDFETGMSRADALRVMERECVDYERGRTSCSLDDGSFITLRFTPETRSLNDIEYSMKTNMSCEALTKVIIEKYNLREGKAPDCAAGGWVYFAKKFSDDHTPGKMMMNDRKRVEISFSFNFGAPMLRILDVAVFSEDLDAQERKRKANPAPPKL